MLPLEGLIVADFSRVVAGPLAAMNLGDLGARVIKVERPSTGDDTRSWGPPWFEEHGFDDHTSTYFHAVNRGKESLQLNLDDPADQSLAHRLTERADIMVENFRTGTLDRFGLGWEECNDRNSSLIYCSIEGFGDTPQAAQLPGYDLLVQAASGLMSVTGESDGRPLKTGVAIVDVVAALQATSGILAAIHQRTTTGLGARIQVSLMDAALAALINQTSGYLGCGVIPHRAGNDHPSIAPYSTYRASDQNFVIACGNDAQFVKLGIVLGIAHTATDPRFETNSQRVTHRHELDAILTSALAERPSAEWITALGAAGVPAGPINTVAEAIQTATDLGLEPTVDVTFADGSTAPSIRSPIRFTPADRPGMISAPPSLGSGDAELRNWLSER